MKKCFFEIFMPGHSKWRETSKRFSKNAVRTRARESVCSHLSHTRARTHKRTHISKFSDTKITSNHFPDFLDTHVSLGVVSDTCIEKMSNIIDHIV